MEFFTSVKDWELLKGKIKEDKHISFYAANNEVIFVETVLTAGWLHDEHG